MKKIIYKIACKRKSLDENKQEILIDDLCSVEIPWSEENENMAKSESYNGEFTIEDDGKPEFVKSPTQLDIIEAQVTYTAMMTDTLLEV